MTRDTSGDGNESRARGMSRDLLAAAVARLGREPESLEELQAAIDAVTADYMELIRTCVACHTYLRRERLIGDFPEKFSMLSPLGPPRAAIP